MVGFDFCLTASSSRRTFDSMKQIAPNNDESRDKSPLFIVVASIQLLNNVLTTQYRAPPARNEKIKMESHTHMRFAQLRLSSN